MRPVIRLCTGLAASLARLVALASCGSIAVVSGSLTLNSGYTWCRYEVQPNKVTQGGNTIDVYPVWHNTTYPGEPVFQDIKIICMLEECGNNEAGKENCRATGPNPMQVISNNFNDDRRYVVTTHPCTKNCTGNKGTW